MYFYPHKLLRHFRHISSNFILTDLRDFQKFLQFLSSHGLRHPSVLSGVLVLRELVVHVDGGETEIVQVRESVAEQLLSGLRLSLIPPLPPNLKPPRFPTDAGLLRNPRIQANNSDGDGLF